MPRIRPNKGLNSTTILSKTQEKSPTPRDFFHFVHVVRELRPPRHTGHLCGPSGMGHGTAAVSGPDRAGRRGRRHQAGGRAPRRHCTRHRLQGSTSRPATTSAAGSLPGSSLLSHVHLLSPGGRAPTYSPFPSPRARLLPASSRCRRASVSPACPPCPPLLAALGRGSWLPSPPPG